MLVYLFMLIAVSNILLMFDITITFYNCLAAIPLSWAILWLIRKQNPFYALLIALAGVAIIALCAYAVGTVYDMGWDSNSYHKVDTGLLAHGWNPFKIKMDDYAVSSGIIANKTDWKVWYDAYPKATYTIGACFYAFTGNIESGKSFNVISMIIFICMGTSLLKKTGRLNYFQSFLIVFLIAVNPVSVSQWLTYYNDGFLGILLACCAMSLVYIDRDEHGDLWRQSWAVVFITLNIGVNAKFSALIFFGILGILFYFYLIARKKKKVGPFKARPFTIKLTLFYIIAIGTAILFTGSVTFIVNLFRYGNPLYSIIGTGAPELIVSQMPQYMLGLPKFGQFIYSVFSGVENQIYVTDNHLKWPLTTTGYEWSDNAAATYDTRASGWGIFFSAVFLITVIAIIIGMYHLKKIRKKRDLYYLFVLMLVFIFIPIFFVPGMWWARYNVQLLWVPAFALGLLFVMLNKKKPIWPILQSTWPKLKSIWPKLFSLVIIALMLVNLWPGLMYCKEEIDETKYSKTELTRLKSLDDLYDYRLIFRDDDFYGQVFDLMDYGLHYTITREPSYQVLYGNFLHYITYEAVPDAAGKPENTARFLSSVKSKSKDYIILIAAADEASNGLDTPTIVAMQSLGLTFDMKDKTGYSYIAVIDGGKVLCEKSSDQKLEYTSEVENKKITLVSAGYNDGWEAQIIIDGNNYALDLRGLNIVVYDKKLGQVVDSVAIDTYLDNALVR